MSRTAIVPIADGTEELEAVAIIDVLRRAGAKVTVASVDGLHVTASRGVKLTADILISECRENTFDLIALPGGMPGAEHLRDCAPLIEMLRDQKARGRLFAAICASPAVVLAHHGLINDKLTTSYPSVQDQLPRRKTDRVVTDGNCITSQGPGTAIEFAIELVRRLYDEKTARQTADAMVVK